MWKPGSLLPIECEAVLELCGSGSRYFGLRFHPEVAAPGVGFIWFENEISKSWLCLEPRVIVFESKLDQFGAEGRCNLSVSNLIV